MKTDDIYKKGSFVTAILLIFDKYTNKTVAQSVER